jgi:hypothetical protein
MLIPILSCFAGSFYSNIAVLTGNAENILPVIIELGITTYYIIKEKIGIIFEKKIDEQDISYGKDLSKNISQRIDGIIIYTTNHDSDILLIYIYKNGTEIFSYDSNPGYFKGDNAEPKIVGIDNFLNEFKGLTKEAIIEILETKEVFADYIHRKIIKLLNLPIFCYFGYQNIEIDKEIYKVEQNYNVKINKLN